MLSLLLASHAAAHAAGRRAAHRHAAEEFALSRVAAAASTTTRDCPCADAKLCQPIGGPAVSEREIYGFGAGLGALDKRVTTVAWPLNSTVMCQAHAAGARVVMAAPQPEKHFSDNATVRALWVNSTVKAVVASHMDGVVFDWESPCDPGAASQRQYALLIAETRAALRKVSPSYQVSTCVAWSPDGIDGRHYDIPAFAAASDLLYVMDYDTRSQIFDACVAAANAPYFGMEHGLQRYLDLGVSPQQLVLGVPWYGYRYECVAGTSATATTCPIPQVPFRGINCSDAAGSEVGLSDILSRLPKSTTGRRWDDYQAAPYFNTVEGGATVQYWYDDVQSLTPKYARARARPPRRRPLFFPRTTDQKMFDAFDAFLKGAAPPAPRAAVFRADVAVYDATAGGVSRRSPSGAPPQPLGGPPVRLVAGVLRKRRAARRRDVERRLGQTRASGSCSDCVGGLAREFYERNRPAVPAQCRRRARRRGRAAPPTTRRTTRRWRPRWRRAVASCRLPAANCTATYNLEPDKALHIFEAMLADAGVTVLYDAQLASVDKDAATGALQRLHLVDGRVVEAAVFVEAGYEGDLLAAAGASYRVGREARAEHNESLAGRTSGNTYHQFATAIDPFDASGAPLPLITTVARGPPAPPLGAADGWCRRTTSGCA